MKVTYKKRQIMSVLVKSKKGFTPTEIGKTLEYPVGQESSRCAPVLKQFINEGFVERSVEAKYKVTSEGRLWYKAAKKIKF